MWPDYELHLQGHLFELLHCRFSYLLERELIFELLKIVHLLLLSVKLLSVPHVGMDQGFVHVENEGVLLSTLR